LIFINACRGTRAVGPRRPSLERTSARRLIRVKPGDGGRHRLRLTAVVAAAGPCMKALRIPCSHLVAALVIAALSGCTTLLPTSKREVVSDWDSYDAAVARIAAIEPYKATRADVHREGLDPRLNPAITVLHFADLLQRFSAAAMIQPEDVDRGIRDCLKAGKRCNAYAISVRKIETHHVGGFWSDTFNFRRDILTTGWSVDALLVFVDDGLVYELVGGQPTISEHDLQRNPLGPLQGWADYAVHAVH